jgi:PAS domain S-box-containing protein
VRVRENFNLSILSDITERKRAEEEAKQSQVLSKTIIDSIPGAFYMIDASGKYFGWNTYQRDEIVGQPESMMSGVYAIDTIHPDDREIIGSKIANVLMKGAEEVVEGRVLLRGGPDFRWLLMTGCRMMIEGSPVLIGIGIDITERKRAEEALRESEEKFRDMANLLPQIIFESDSSGHLTYLNKNAYEIFGYPEDYPVLGKSSLDFYTPESRIKAVENIRQRVTGSLTTENNEYRMIRKDGSTFPALVYSNPIMKEGKPVGLRGIIVNITEIKQAEEKVNEQLNELRRWHEVTLGREGRVLELKQEVNELLKQHGEALRYESHFPDEPDVEKNKL